MATWRRRPLTLALCCALLWGRVSGRVWSCPRSLLARMLFLKFTLLALDTSLLFHLFRLSSLLLVFFSPSLLLNLFSKHLRLQAPSLALAIGVISIIAEEVAAPKPMRRLVRRRQVLGRVPWCGYPCSRR